MIKVYISGKITGLDIEEAKYNFSNAEVLLKDMGFIPVNPMKSVLYNPVWEWWEYMRDDIALLLRCEAIAMQANWRESKGARLELAIAKELGMQIIYLK